MNLLRSKKECPQCAESVQQAARVCRYCGYEFQEDGSTRTPTAPPEPKKERPERAREVPEPKPSGSPDRQTRAGEKSSRRSRLATAGFIAAAASFLLPPLFLVPVVIGIILLVRGQWGNGAAVVLLGLVLPFIGALVIQSFLVKPYRTPSESMEPTLNVGDRVLVNRLSGDPGRGDIVVFHPPAGAASNTCGVSKPENQACAEPSPERDSVTFIKRVAAVPGDTLSIRNGHAVVNGTQQDESYARPCAPGTCNFPRPIKIPAGHFFVLGDNRGASDDSRFWGPVKKDWIVGKVFLTYSPLGHFGSP